MIPEGLIELAREMVEVGGRYGAARPALFVLAQGVLDMYVTLQRAQYVAQNLMQMISDTQWEDSGAVSFEGHSEGLYRAYMLAQEINNWTEVASDGKGNVAEA